MKIVFFDYNTEKIDAYEKIFFTYKRLSGTPELEFICCDVKELFNTRPGIHMIVSPANSKGDMDGGIDEVYSKMFPRIEKAVKKRIKEATNGMSYLPIGSAILLGMNNKSCPFLIIAPTMTHPQSLLGREGNIYWTMIGILSLINNIQNNKLVIAIPCLGTGIGNLSGIESAELVKHAFEDYYFGKVKHIKKIVKDSSTAFVLSKRK
jgi:O-acetyl-ADP-ribose deacetylase (regulator of RNase III)